MLDLILMFVRESAKAPRFGVGLAFAIVLQAIFQLGSPLAMKFIFDEGITQQNSRVLFMALAGWAGLFLLFAIGTFAQEYCNTRLGVRVVNAIRQNIFEKIQALPPDHFVHHSPSEAASVFNSDVNAVETAFVRAFPSFILYALVIVVSLVLLFVIEWRLALVTLASLAVVVLLPKTFGRFATRKTEDYARASDKMSNLVSESAATHVIVRLFALGRQRGDKFAQELRTLGEAGAAAHLFVGLVGRTAFIGTGFSQLVVIGVGAVLALSGYMTAGMLVAFIGLILRIGDGVSQLSSAIPLLIPAASARKRLEEFLAQEVPVIESPQARSVERLSGDIVFENVSFAYDSSTPVLKNLSFSIRAGEAVAFVGPSGSGKSTVISLLLRIRRASAGRILLDGRPIEDIAEESLRANMSVVPQNAILFEATVRDNILVGRPEAAEDEVIEAAKAANIHESLMAKPDGYDTMASMSGGALSGGERQRVATARAFLRDAPILLLDEATSALDPSSEAAVNRSITNRAGQHTVVAVTHRLGAIVDFDRIFVLRSGTLVESGRHAELLARNGLYRELWDKQQGMSLDTESGAPAIRAERLALIPFLSGCGTETLSELASLFTVEQFREGTYVFRQGDAGQKFYVVARGRLEARIEGDAGERVVATLLDGDFFGELALVKNQPRAASIVALNESWCLSLPRQHFLALMKTEKTVRTRIEAAIMKIQSPEHAAA